MTPLRFYKQSAPPLVFSESALPPDSVADVVTIYPTWRSFEEVCEAIAMAREQNTEPDMIALGPEVALEIEAARLQPDGRTPLRGHASSARIPSGTVSVLFGVPVVCDPAAPPRSIRVLFRPLTAALGPRVTPRPVLSLVERAAFLHLEIGRLQDALVALDAEMARTDHGEEPPQPKGTE